MSIIISNAKPTPTIVTFLLILALKSLYSRSSFACKIKHFLIFQNNLQPCNPKLFSHLLLSTTHGLLLMAYSLLLIIFIWARPSVSQPTSPFPKGGQGDSLSTLRFPLSARQAAATKPLQSLARCPHQRLIVTITSSSASSLND